MCGSAHSGVTKKRRIMDPKLLDIVERQVLSGALDLSLTVAGEPFMTPRISSFVDVAERAGADLQLNTNITLLPNDKVLKRVMGRASVLKISVDGASPEVYNKIRRGGDFNQVVRNIRYLVRLRDALPKELQPRLAVCMVLMRQNVHELVDMVELVHGLGIGRLEVAHMTVIVPEMASEELRLVPDLADKWLIDARNRADELGLRTVLPPLFSSGKVVRVTQQAKIRLALNEVLGITGHRLGRLSKTVFHKAKLLKWSKQAGGNVPCHFLMVYRW